MIYACPICKILSLRRALCEYCATQLHAKLEPVCREADEFNTYSLFTWERDGWPGLRWWVHALKGREHPYFWRDAAVWALDTFPRVSKPYLMPIPSTKSRNHARGFAKTIGALTGWPVIESLVPQAARAQKTLTRTARAKRRFQVAENAPLPRGTCILVDDVITSGATARAAFRALGRPKNFQVWCLMDRRPSHVG